MQSPGTANVYRPVVDRSTDLGSHCKFLTCSPSIQLSLRVQSQFSNFKKSTLRCFWLAIHAQLDSVVDSKSPPIPFGVLLGCSYRCPCDSCEVICVVHVLLIMLSCQLPVQFLPQFNDLLMLRKIWQGMKGNRLRWCVEEVSALANIDVWEIYFIKALQLIICFFLSSRLFNSLPFLNPHPSPLLLPSSCIQPTVDAYNCAKQRKRYVYFSFFYWISFPLLPQPYAPVITIVRGGEIGEMNECVSLYINSYFNYSEMCVFVL